MLDRSVSQFEANPTVANLLAAARLIPSLKEDRDEALVFFKQPYRKQPYIDRITQRIRSLAYEGYQEKNLTQAQQLARAVADLPGYQAVKEILSLTMVEAILWGIVNEPDRIRSDVLDGYELKITSALKDGQAILRFRFPETDQEYLTLAEVEKKPAEGAGHLIPAGLHFVSQNLPEDISLKVNEKGEIILLDKDWISDDQYPVSVLLSKISEETLKTIAGRLPPPPPTIADSEPEEIRNARFDSATLQFRNGRLISGTLERESTFTIKGRQYVFPEDTTVEFYDQAEEVLEGTAFVTKTYRGVKSVRLTEDTAFLVEGKDIKFAGGTNVVFYPDGSVNYGTLAEEASLQVKEQKIKFAPHAMVRFYGNESVMFGTLAEDTEIPVNNHRIKFAKGTDINFHDHGMLMSGILAKNVRFKFEALGRTIIIELAKDKRIALHRNGSFYRGFLASPVIIDGETFEEGTQVVFEEENP